jgi:REP element-mobilizing transposase RayT
MKNDGPRAKNGVGPCRPATGRHAPSPSPVRLETSSNSPPRTNFPLAYHITFGTYGTRLHGDPRGTVDRSQNEFGEPIVGRDDEWKSFEQKNLNFQPLILTIEQRVFIERQVPTICERGGWEFLQVAAAPDHIHNMVSARIDGKDIRKWLKRWLSEALSAIWPLRYREVWWSECGSVKWIWTEDYYERVRNYIQKQRTVQ